LSEMNKISMAHRISGRNRDRNYQHL
jgi:hypothetical protein